MKRLFTLFGLVCLIAMILPACAPAPEPAPEPVFDQAAEEEAVRRADKKFNDVWNAQDAEAIAATRDDSEESWDGTVKHGEDDVTVLETWFAGPFKNARSTLLDEIGVVFVTQEVAIYKARYEWSGMVDEEGNSVPPMKMLYARVYVKRNGEWLGAGYFIRPIDE